MRRVLIPAAILVAAAYVARRRDAARPPQAAPLPWTPEMSRAQAEAEDAMLIAQGQTAAAFAPDLMGPDPDEGPGIDLPAHPPAAPPPPAGAAEVVETGRFSTGGWAAQVGDIAVCGVTFEARRPRPVHIAAIRLHIDGVSNATSGPIVLSDPGFAPDEEGFTLMMAAAGPGTFAAAGRYEVLAV